MLNRLLNNLKHRSNVTLRQWSYQCEYIFAQRSRRAQQLLTFYHRVWGDTGFKELLRSYRTQFQPPIKGLMLSAVGALAFDWNNERIQLSKFEVCRPDMDFIDRVERALVCEVCQQWSREVCYCASNTDERIWEPYVTRDNYTIWKREEKPSLYAYKIYVHHDDVSADDFLNVQTDIEYRKKWDATAVKLEVIESDTMPNSNSDLLYWEMQWPRFFANRDYVYCRRILTDKENNAILIYNQSARHPKYPEDPYKVRVHEYWSYMVIKPYKNFHEPGIHYVLTYFDDPGLAIPARVKSWVTQSQMPDFLKRLYEATKEYARYRSQSKTQHISSQFKISTSEYRANEDRGSRLDSCGNVGGSSRVSKMEHIQIGK
ncbi:stAR-related lipid transfer protein 7, mitochondrial [Episyrphus balteatus]|uniref:stAR-related lipid transfer protein 7, mitochondrial n=1 Tax=Episyrphus balteatus TaxID=286459 RepID=UPI002484EDF5|nr:stAR-related lipid transfer protein 7, mitochondrial [Episyrphus balteatus]